MDKYAEVCWRNKPDEINDALASYRAEIDALRAELAHVKRELVKSDHRVYEDLMPENKRLREALEALHLRLKFNAEGKQPYGGFHTTLDEFQSLEVQAAKAIGYIAQAAHNSGDKDE